MSAVQKVLWANPLIAILRGVTPDEVIDVGSALIAAGFKVIEVPLNSPDALTSIRLLRAHADDTVVVGAGTTMSAADVDRAAVAGATLILSPHMDANVIHRTLAHGLFSMPGVATATEAFAGLHAGAQSLKVFPADILGLGTIKAWKAVLPINTPLFAVGGIDAGNLQQFRLAGVQGAGLGSSLFVPGISLKELRSRAEHLMAVWKNDTGN